MSAKKEVGMSSKTIYAAIDEMSGTFALFKSLAEAEAQARALYRSDEAAGWLSKLEVLEVTCKVTCKVELAACQFADPHWGMYRMMGWRAGRILSSLEVEADLNQMEWHSEAIWELEYEGTAVRAVKTLKGKVIDSWNVGEMV